ncbi:MAG TPA: hypothetical protein VF618_01020 [Thermoanaerobaculia bacterium]
MARRGFLTLNDCGNPGSTVCATCARPMCPEHLSPSSGFANCLDCGARAQQEEGTEGETDTEQAIPEDVDAEWAYGYRHRYYGSGYAPIYAGSQNDRYYDNYDTRSFDSSVNDSSFDETEDDAGGGADFGDS